MNKKNIKNSADIENFTNLDIRIGTIISAQYFPEATKPAYKLKIDFGEMGILNSSAQITDAYQPESIVGTQIIAVVNFSPKQIANFISECLVLAVVDENKSAILLRPDRKLENGLCIS